MHVLEKLEEEGYFPLLRHLTGSLQSAYLRSKGSSWHHSSISENPDSSRHRSYSHWWFWWTFGLLLGLLLRNPEQVWAFKGPLFGFWPIKKCLGSSLPTSAYADPSSCPVSLLELSFDFLNVDIRVSLNHYSTKKFPQLNHTDTPLNRTCQLGQKIHSSWDFGLRAVTRLSLSEDSGYNRAPWHSSR